jgi:hypothetical protein
MFGHVAVLDTAGRPGPPLEGYSCDPWSVLPDETVLCDDDGQQRNFSVRGRDGSVRYRFHATGDVQYLDLVLAPDASRVVYLPTGGKAQVTDSTGKTTQLPASFKPEGEGDMALVQLARPTRLQDLGFHGYFVGVVQN